MRAYQSTIDGVVKSTATGTVANLSVAAGQSVNGTANALVIESASGVWVELAINETDISFYGEDGELGRLTFDDNQIHFEGKADESAKQFFEHFLKPMCDNYIKEQLKNGAEKKAKDGPERTAGSGGDSA